MSKLPVHPFADMSLIFERLAPHFEDLYNERQPFPVLGINSHILEAPDLTQVQELGLSHVRSTIVTQFWEDIPSYKAAMAAHVQRCNSYGIELLFVIHNNDGTYFRGTDLAGPTATMLDIVEFLESAGNVEAYQLWNEQDSWHQAPFDAGLIPPEESGRKYARWWNEQIPRFRALTDAKFITGPVADNPFGGQPWRGFLAGMIAEGIDYVDGVGVHTYGPWHGDVFPHIVEARARIGLGYPIWLTEFGTDAIGAGWSEAIQRQAWQSTIENAEAGRWVERLYGYCLQTDPNDPTHGLFDPVTGAPRQTYNWLKNR